MAAAENTTNEQENKRDWSKICQIIASGILALAALFWISQGIVTKDDLEPIRNDIQSLREEVSSIRTDLTYIRENMITKSDIQQLQSDVAQVRENHVNHLTYQHGGDKR